MSTGRKPVVIATFGILALMASSTVISSEQAGVVLSMKGNAVASDAAGTVRTLKRGEKIFENDVVCTDADSQLQLKMKDGALYTLKPQSRLDIEQYSYDDAGKGDNAVSMELVEGALRTVSGAVGKSDPDAYTLKAGAASIGIRGTEFEVAYKNPPGTPLAEWCLRN